MEKNPLTRYGIFVGTFGFLLGVAFASQNLLSTATAVFLCFLGVVLGGYAYILREKRLRGMYALCALLFLFCGLGIFRSTFDTLPHDDLLKKRIDSKTSIEGEIVEEPRLGESYRQYVVKVSSGVKVLVRVSPFPEHRFGERVQAFGKLELPKAFETPEGRVFDYPAYLRKEGISYVMSFGNMTTVGDPSFGVQTFLYSIKHRFLSVLETVIPFPESGLLSGVLLGATDGIPKDMLTVFRIVGIIHIVVLSGYNITIVAESIRKSLSFLSLRKGLLVSAFGIILFSTMVGWTSSVMRASVMAFLALIAKATRRKYDVSRAVCLAALCMVIINPRFLFDDLGFQLSFLATIALIWISPIVEKKLTFIPEKFGLRDIISTTIAVQLFVLPLLVYTNGFISIAGFLVNVLVLPLVPLLMVLGFVTALLALVSSALAFIPAAVTYGILWYIIFVSEKFSSFSWSTITLSHVSVLFPIIFYIGILLIVLYRKRKELGVVTPSSDPTYS